MFSNSYKIEKIREEENVEIWETAFPVIDSGKTIGITRIKYKVHDIFNHFYYIILWIGIIAVIMSIFLSYIFSQSISKSIRKVVSLINEYGKGNFDVAIENNHHDEFGELIISLSKLSNSFKSMMEENISNENLVMMGEFAAFIIHDLKNPISGIHLLAEGLNKKISTNDNLKKYSNEILLASQKLDDFIKKILDIAKPTGLNTQPIKINKLIDDVLNDIDLSAIEIEKRFDKSATEIVGDYQLLYRAITNILCNAIESIESIEFEGKIIIGTKKEDNLIIKISDNGKGIDENRIKTIFRPFYSSKKLGHGLGLAMAKKAILMHNGTIEVESKKGSGTIFTITLPKYNKHHATLSNQKKKE